MKRAVFLISAIVVFGTAVVSGQIVGNPENWCRNGMFPKESEEYRIGIVRGRSRAYFLDDADGCPAGKQCRTKSYIVPGDEVIVSRTFGSFACVWFQPKSGSETVGWIPVARLSFPKRLNGALSDFGGRWVFYDNTVSIRPAKTRNHWQLKGEAFWKGLGDNIHIGELDGDGLSAGSRLEYGDGSGGKYDCVARFIRIGRYLIGSDNGNCGGANVTFNGVYVRKR